MKSGSIYIITNTNNTVLYTGVTSDLIGRIWEHRNKKYPTSFSARYNLHKLVYFEHLSSITDAIAREKQIKAGSRKKKIALIEEENQAWNDLYPRILEEGF